MNLRLLLPLLLTAVLGLTGCPPDTEVAPAFVTFAGFNLETPNVGPASEAITEVWVFAGDEFVGAFPIPARIPLLKVGSVDMRFAAGVRQDGVSATPEIYPFYAEATQTVELVPGETVDIGVQTIGYRPDARFSINEGFEEGVDRAFSLRIRGDSTLLPSQEDVRYGEFSGKACLSMESPLLEVATAATFRDLIPNSTSVWLEVDYRSDAFLNYGVSGFVDLQPVRVFDPITRPRNEWTKIYFNLTEIIVRSQLDQFSLSISALLPTEMATGNVYLDNIRLVHF